MRSDFVFPDRLTDVKLKLSDRGYLIAESLGPFDGIKGFLNATLRNYWQDLRAKKVVNDDFCKFMSQKGNTYNQLIFSDLRSYKMKERSTLSVESLFQGTNPCPGNLYIVCCAVKEGVLSKKGHEWFMKSVVP